jgi:hypothetical protein
VRPRRLLLALGVLLTALRPVGLAAVPPAGAIAAPPGIASDCSADVTAALSAWIASVPNGATLALRDGGCYRLDGTLRIDDRTGLVVEGRGATFKAVQDPDPRRRHILISGGGDLLIRDLTVVGNHPNGGTSAEAYSAQREFQHAFALAGVQGLRLERVRASDVWGDFVYIGPDLRGGRTVWSRNVTVVHSTFERNGRQGIAIVAGEDVVIDSNHLAQVRRATFNMEPTTEDWGARRVRITNNVTGRGRLLWFSSGGAGSNVSDIVIAGNTMQEATGTPVVYMVAPRGARRGPVLIENNTLIVGGSPEPGFRFARVSGLTIRNNRATFPASRLMTAVGLEEAQQATIQGNRFCGAARVIAAQDSSALTETANVTACP